MGKSGGGTRTKSGYLVAYRVEHEGQVGYLGSRAGYQSREVEERRTSRSEEGSRRVIRIGWLVSGRRLEVKILNGRVAFAGIASYVPADLIQDEEPQDNVGQIASRRRAIRARRGQRDGSVLHADHESIVEPYWNRTRRRSWSSGVLQRCTDGHWCVRHLQLYKYDHEVRVKIYLSRGCWREGSTGTHRHSMRSKSYGDGPR